MGKSAGGGGGGVGTAPDPFQTAQQQRAFNTQAAMDSARMNQVNQWTPFGGTYWTGEIGSPNRAQHTVVNPILGRILFGGSYHPHFPGMGGKGGVPGYGGGYPGGGMPSHGDPGFGLGSLPPEVTQPPATPSTPVAPHGDPSPDRGGPDRSGIGAFDPGVARYDSLGDFINAMKVGIQTGNWGKPYSGEPGHGPVGSYRGPDASLARDVAKHTLGEFHPVMNPKTKPKKITVHNTTQPAGSRPPGHQPVGTAVGPDASRVSRVAKTLGQGFHPVNKQSTTKKPTKVSVSTGTTNRDRTSAPTSSKGTSLAPGINRGGNQNTGRGTSAPTSSKGTSLGPGINRGGNQNRGPSRGERGVGPASGGRGGSNPGRGGGAPAGGRGGRGGGGRGGSDRGGRGGRGGAPGGGGRGGGGRF